MAEIKTCEQYVLAKLQETEEENANLVENLASLGKDCAKLQQAVQTMKTLFQKYGEIRSFESTASGDKLNYYFRMDDVDAWKFDTKEDFFLLVDVFGLELPEQAKKEENDGSSTGN